MPIENILMPQLGESVTEGIIERWLVQPGEYVNKYDPLAEVITDKVNAEIPSSFAGIIKELIAQEGTTLPVGAIVCTIETNEGLISSSSPNNTNVSTAQLKDDIERNNQQKQIKDKKIHQKARYSPAVLRLANEHHIDLSLVQGTGLEGRITRKDLLKIIETGQIPTTCSTEIAKEEMQHVEHISKQQGEYSKEYITPLSHDIEIPVSSVRKAIAAKMVQSKTEIPHAWMMMEADVTNLVAYREQIKSEFKKAEGFNITYFAFFIKAIAQSLKEYPMMNAIWQGDKIIQRKDIHLSIAVATEDALFVPVIRHADEKSIKGIAREIYELSTLAQSGKLRSEHIQGGTFTVNNTGSFGSIQSMGIINYPQAAILQVEEIVKKMTVLQENMFAARDMVNLCLSIDHRILDGFISGKFLKRVKEILEKTNYNEMSVY